MLSNLEKDLFEDGTPCKISAAMREESIKFWSLRENRVLHSVVNTALQCKVRIFNNAIIINFDIIHKKIFK